MRLLTEARAPATLEAVSVAKISFSPRANPMAEIPKVMKPRSTLPVARAI